MKKIIFILSILVTAFYQNIAAQAQPKLQVKAGNIIINGTTIQVPWSFTQFTSSKALGQYTRDDLGNGNDIFTYDNAGIMLYRATNKNIIAFNVYWGKDENEYQSFNPNGYYKGKIQVEKFTITSTTSIDAVRKALPKYNFVMTSIEAYRGEYKGLYIYLRYDATESNILWSSIGRNDYY